jgi:hypothetical protein
LKSVDDRDSFSTLFAALLLRGLLASPFPPVNRVPTFCKRAIDSWYEPSPIAEDDFRCERIALSISALEKEALILARAFINPDAAASDIACTGSLGSEASPTEPGGGCIIYIPS